MNRDVTGLSCLNRRAFLQLTGAGLTTLALSGSTKADEPKPVPKGKPTRFQVACMTLPYSQFSLDTALKGIKGAGYQYVAWGTTHQEDGKRVPVLAGDASPEKAKQLATKCRDLGLKPVLLFGP